MSRIWKFNLFLLALIIIAILYVMFMNKSEEVAPAPKPVIAVKPSVEIIEQGESIYGYTSTGETPQGDSERVYFAKALTITNPHDFPITIIGAINDTYDTSDSRISSDEGFGFVTRRTLAPGEVAHVAGTVYLSEINFREDFGSSEITFDLVKEEGASVPYTNLDTLSTSYRFEDADPGNTLLKIDAEFGNSSTLNVDTSKLQFVVYFYDSNGTLIGGDTKTYITYTPERIRPGEQKQISFDGALLGRELSRDVGSIKVFAGCGNCKA
ncbi:hypothetical protein [Cohnella herbarum]|uniref:Uncharacterized protein n=1 Tax=Cohnella herbarum TaxID=2728023 RepID=A0A7Z2ZML1_9BACL|nr:hypothetical protein [Cohnella herbarum]QJD85193.1 hypothetical protein HH215_19775 [Cohnella herbarum]